jgi:hypothetical protein
VTTNGESDVLIATKPLKVSRSMIPETVQPKLFAEKYFIANESLVNRQYRLDTIFQAAP